MLRNSTRRFTLQHLVYCRECIISIYEIGHLKLICLLGNVHETKSTDCMNEPTKYENNNKYHHYWQSEQKPKYYYDYGTRFNQIGQDLSHIN
jgi:hypothetical protein